MIVCSWSCASAPLHDRPLWRAGEPLVLLYAALYALWRPFCFASPAIGVILRCRAVFPAAADVFLLVFSTPPQSACFAGKVKMKEGPSSSNAKMLIFGSVLGHHRADLRRWALRRCCRRCCALPAGPRFRPRRYFWARAPLGARGADLRFRVSNRG
jgi:hypothetical protein